MDGVSVLGVRVGVSSGAGSRGFHSFGDLFREELTLRVEVVQFTLTKTVLLPLRLPTKFRGVKAQRAKFQQPETPGNWWAGKYW